VIKDGVIAIRRPKTVQLLPGITVDGMCTHCQATTLASEWIFDRSRASELKEADEIWLSSSGREVLAIVSLDGAVVGVRERYAGKPGPMYIGDVSMVSAEPSWMTRVTGSTPRLRTPRTRASERIA
jgi:D-alanine transaminase